MMQYWAICLSTFLLASIATAVPPESSASERTATREDTRRAINITPSQSFGSTVRRLSETFRVPISFEWSYVNDDRSAVVSPDVSFSVQPGETLATTLDRFCVATRGQLQWQRIHGIFCVWPTGTSGKVESVLDVPVTLHLQGVSTWQAFLELARAVNANSNAPSVRYLQPRAEPVQGAFMPPASLRRDTSITLDLENVTAREAACAIMAASPHHMEFQYSNHYNLERSKLRQPLSEISLWVFDENRQVISERMSTKDDFAAEFLWRKEAESVVPQSEPAPNPALEP